MLPVRQRPFLVIHKLRQQPISCLCSKYPVGNCIDLAMDASKLRRCEHQVGGHMTKDDKPDTMVDDAGRFYKPYQNDARNEREAAFYQMLWSSKQPSIINGVTTPVLPAEAVMAKQAEPTSEGAQVSDMSQALIPPWGKGDMYGPGQGKMPRDEDVAGLKEFIPCYYGATAMEGRRYIVLQDVCGAYQQPCVLDAKIGLTTVYSWADEAYQNKCRQKDASTTQNSVGFRISGLQVYNQHEGEMTKVPRSYGRSLTADNIKEPFNTFANNGALTPKDLFGPGSELLASLGKLRSWFETQRSFQFFQASVLLTYEGTATRMEDAKPQVHLIDFAHTYHSNGEQDTNFLQGLDSLISILNSLGQ